MRIGQQPVAMANMVRVDVGLDKASPPGTTARDRYASQGAPVVTPYRRACGKSTPGQASRGNHDDPSTRLPAGDRDCAWARENLQPVSPVLGARAIQCRGAEVLRSPVCNHA